MYSADTIEGPRAPAVKLTARHSSLTRVRAAPLSPQLESKEARVHCWMWGVGAYQKPREGGFSLLAVERSGAIVFSRVSMDWQEIDTEGPT